MKDTEHYRLELIIGNLRKENGALLEENARLKDPKADPKEKELYSIKPLEWVSVSRRPYNSYLIKEKAIPSFGLDYSVIYDGENFWWRYGAGEKMPCENTEDGKRQAQDHFNSKLKLCLNREL